LLMMCFSFSPAPKETSMSSQDQATIYVYHTGQNLKTGADWSILVDDKKACQLASNRFIRLTVPAGKHSLGSAQSGVNVFKKQNHVELNAEAGKSYYIAYNVKAGKTRPEVGMILVTKSTADQQMASLQPGSCQ
jgi:hypothetical protein